MTEPQHALTERQRKIARRLALGESVDELARRLGVRPQQVRRLLTEIYRQTGTRSQAELVGWCVANETVTVRELQGVYVKTTVDRGTEWEPERKGATAAPAPGGYGAQSREGSRPGAGRVHGQFAG